MSDGTAAYKARQANIEERLKQVAYLVPHPASDGISELKFDCAWLLMNLRLHDAWLAQAMEYEKLLLPLRELYVTPGGLTPKQKHVVEPILECFTSIFELPKGSA